MKTFYEGREFTMITILIYIESSLKKEGGGRRNIDF